jgi:hypothetical protein
MIVDIEIKVKAVMLLIGDQVPGILLLGMNENEK